MCVEVDLQEKVVEGFPLVVGQNQVLQHVRYEKRGLYCNKCFRQGHTAVVCRVGDKSIRNEGLRKEREEKDQGNIRITREKEFESLDVENLQLAVIVEDSEIVLNVSKESENVLNVSGLNFRGISHVPRDANMVQHGLAKLAISTGCDQYWLEEVPSIVGPIVLDDAKLPYGGSNFRGISHVPRDANMVQHGLAKLAISSGCDQYWLEDVPSATGPIVLDDAKLP
ncbi:hypothetical protein Q3G72_020153 [Acer saccharum]|nr:hypothetical protein Q3G72_020153 [Acer saccharum]